MQSFIFATRKNLRAKGGASRTLADVCNHGACTRCSLTRVSKTKHGELRGAASKDGIACRPPSRCPHFTYLKLTRASAGFYLQSRRCTGALASTSVSSLHPSTQLSNLTTPNRAVALALSPSRETRCV
ncbi:hypothetical protein B0H67DRAFT_120062 [Lasiosphaeris hirsuta]|uniref:Uncharacterized protein n=1 Tax=Lasiosphaeris hirsuta TaxID=260670 RepID=A0AA40E204_9PEZI|nr:hypothetical protein B0H67DRAFT_120062 [Lasiosphaeris hirsuta]